MRKIAIFLLGLLLFLLPFHPFLSTFLNTHVFPDNAQISFLIQAWKEILILLFCSISFGVWWENRKQSPLDSLDFAIILFLIVSLICGVLFTGEGNPLPIIGNDGILTAKYEQIIWGAKYGLLFLVLFLFARHIPLNNDEKRGLVDITLLSATAVIIFGIVQATVLPEDFLTHFGYNAEYGITETGERISYCHKIENAITHKEFCRVQSLLSGPNQLGAYLLVVLPLFFYRMILAESFFVSLLYFFPLLMGGGVLIMTWSRSAWIGAIAMAAALFIVEANRPRKALLYLAFFGLGISAVFFPILSIEHWDDLKPVALIGGGVGLFFLLMMMIQNVIKEWFSGLGSIIFLITLIAVVAVRAVKDTFFWNIILRPSSSQGHWERWSDGAKYIFENPFGLGLGDAGPASARFANPGETGFLPESWYLQVGLESGFIGLALFVTILILVALRLIAVDNTESRPMFLSLAGVSAASLFLHSWESAVVAFSFWALTGIAVAPNPDDTLLGKVKNFLGQFFKS
jgi:NADH:ubiquinone oxidoreductase subunit 6 (subunit J)